MNDINDRKAIEKAMEEIRSGKQQTASTLALEMKRERTRLPFLYEIFTFRVLMSLMIIFLIIGALLVIYYKLFAANSNKFNATTIVEQVHELSTLTTAEAVVTTVIKEEDNKLFDQKININLPGTKRIALIIVPAKVMAGVDLKSITKKNIHIDEKKKEITLTIPHATIQEPSIQLDKIQTYSKEGIFRHDVNWDEGFSLASEAKKQIKKEAINMGLLAKADDSATKALSHFFELIGYKAHIQFQ